MNYFQRLGWVAAAGLIGFFVASGFQTPSQKVGVVDLGEVFKTSEMTKRKQQELRAMGDARSEMLRFFHTYRVMTAEQAGRFRELSLKAAATPAEKSELEKLKNDAMAADRTLKTLQTKQKPTPEELKQLNDLSERSKQAQLIERKWGQELDDEMRDHQSKLKDAVIADIRSSVRDIAKKQGYTLVFVRDIAPYSPNDLTGDALKAVNAKK